MAKVVGIDLGTTNSCVAVMEGGQPIVIANTEGSRTTPSVVAYTKTGDKLVGQIAKRQAVMNPDNTFYSVKRFIGRKYDEITGEAKQVSYKVLRDSNGNVKLDCPIQKKQFAPEEISAEVLRKLVDDASKYLGEPVKQAVITVPAYFNDSQRQATKDAGRIAGIEVLRIINEPTAASLAYGLDKKSNETILVFDLGGGTFDVSILEVGDGVFEVKSTSGDTHLGGDDFDKKIVDWLAIEFQRNEGVDLRKDKQALQRLTEAAEKAKIELSGATQTNINLPFITATQDGPKHLDMTLTRSQFEQMCSDLFDRCRIPVNQALQDAKLTASDIDEVVLAGEVKDVLLLDVTPLSLGVETLGGVMTKLIERNTTIPVKKSEIFSTAADGQTNVEIHVLQGEREMAADNKSLGTFRLDGIPPAPRGVPQIEVTFDIDANGILSVSAKEKATGKQQSITITGASTLDKSDVERMVREAERNAEEDRRKRDRVDTKNTADSVAYQAEKQLQDLGDKVPSADKARLEGMIKDLREAIDRENYERMKSLTNDIQQALMQIGSAVYSQTGSQTGSTSSDSKGGDEDVIDADFVEHR
ncbi:molecular chaperone DnaK [Pleurocapsales cyanobacterium LEGE 06147]|nr:molecular chaperone DnaK [Pleurocapsales cyanobacterium LEGE 06147]